MIFKIFRVRGDLDRLGLNRLRDWTNGRAGFFDILFQNLQNFRLWGDFFDLFDLGLLIKRLRQGVKPFVKGCDRTAMYASEANVNEILKG